MYEELFLEYCSVAEVDLTGIIGNEGMEWLVCMEDTWKKSPETIKGIVLNFSIFWLAQKTKIVLEAVTMKLKAPV